MSEGTLRSTPATFDYARPLGAAFQRFCLTANGLAAPDTACDTARHCELGFGQGVSLCVHAAAQPGQFWGVDIHAGQVAHAQTLAASFDAAESRVHLRAQSFCELAQSQDLPQFDTISLHGVWSRISPDDRAAVVQFVRSHLKPGGTFYVDYDTSPGWEAFTPLRKLMALYDRYGESSANGQEGRASAAVDFVTRLLEAQPVYMQHVPLLPLRLRQMAEAGADTIVQDYFNPHWEPTWFTAMVQTMTDAGLDWGCTAQPVRSVQALHVGEDAAAFLRQIQHPIAREQVQDFLSEDAQRSDIFLRGTQTLTAQEQRRQLGATRFALLRPVHSIRAALKLDERQQREDTPFYEAILAFFAAHAGQPRPLDELIAGMAEGDYLNHSMALLVLVGLGHMAPCQGEDAARAAAPRCAALNARICASALTTPRIHTLASPVLGAGFGPLAREQLLLLHARALCRAEGAGADDPAAWVQKAQTLLQAQGEALRVGDEELTASAAADHLHAHARELVGNLQPLLDALGVEVRSAAA